MAWLTRLGWLIGGKDTKANIVIVGLLNSGKSTIMQQLKPREIPMDHMDPTIPLTEFHAERFQFKGLTFSAFDVGDLRGVGNPWEDFYKDCHGIIFVVDSSDRMNMPAVKIQLDNLLKHPLLKNKKIPVLFLANKMDLPGSVSGYQLRDLLHLKDIAKKPWDVCSTDGLTGEGLGEGLDWLALQLKKVCNQSASSW